MKKTAHKHKIFRSDIVLNDIFSKNLSFIGLSVILLVLIVYLIFTNMQNMSERLIKLEDNSQKNIPMNITESTPTKM